MQVIVESRIAHRSQFYCRYAELTHRDAAIFSRRVLPAAVTNVESSARIPDNGEFISRFTPPRSPFFTAPFILPRPIFLLARLFQKHLQ